MKRFAIALLCGVGGYATVASASYFLIEQFSSNVHDRAIEAAMTSVFVFGPLGAIVAFIVAFVRLGRDSARTRTDA